MFDRATAQMIVEKLDRNLITVKEAKEFMKKNYNITVDGRAKETVIRFIFRAAKD